MDVRPASGPDDAAHVGDLVDRAFTLYIPRIGRKPMPMESDWTALVGSGRCWVAVDDREIVGVVHLIPAGDHLEVETLAVSPQAQGRGVGGRLLAFAEEQARGRGLPEVRLCTNAAMTENIAYYPRRGYAETHRETQQGFSRVFFTKTL
ncbi:GNAT family N-acetyltransferase [Actinoplanes bogorensis]|uniref:GNAT family N-acetyltransferase n=1 Tax=Paractinoplanes bogorensis TaxID=1610840 RepID=A0ABS5Z0F7_9ACTN|nr:GNAT family N-acetyltransferase [Actinoplanes bogorensis]MBU2669170.1 GNAT family N-acetyltransferase [Actinoplanes bogorensis]